MHTMIDTRLYTLVGISDEHTSCDCCGRQNLKRTMVLRPTDGGEFVFFGTGCGSKALTWAEGNKTARKMGADALTRKAEAAQRAADMERKSSERDALEQAHPLWAMIVETEARITCPDGIEYRAHLNSWRATPESWAFYTSQRDYANKLRAEVRAELDAQYGPLKF